MNRLNSVHQQHGAQIQPSHQPPIPTTLPLRYIPSTIHEATQPTCVGQSLTVGHQAIGEVFRA